MLTVHPEATYHLDRLIHQIKDAGMQAGVALNPATGSERCEWVLGDVDRILIMTVNPGFGGQQFIPRMVDKIRWLDARRSEMNRSFEIAVDGGITDQNAPDVVRAGATALVAGSWVFKHRAGLGAALNELRKAGERGAAEAGI